MIGPAAVWRWTATADENEDVTITLAEAFNYAKVLTIRDTALHTETPQHPSFRMHLRGKNDLPLVTMSETTGARETSVRRDTILTFRFLLSFLLLLR